MILQPCYDFLEPNKSIVLDQTKASVANKGESYEGEAEVRLEFIPKTGIYIHTSLPSLPSDIEVLTVGSNDVPGFVVWETIPIAGKVNFVWCPRAEPIIGRGDKSTQIISVIFHLFNYRDFFGIRRSIEHIGRASHAIQHIELNADGWNIELKSMTTTRDTFETLKKTGGYGLTHVGCLQRADGTSFNGKTAEDMLNALRIFFSFSNGMWCNPCLAVGFDNKESKVWEAWSSPKGQWCTPISWFDPQHCEQLTNLFPGFTARWKNEDWRKALHEVIYWYLSSNCSSLGLGIGIDAGIILTQAAIERLSFEYAVRHKRLVEVNGFKDLRASDKFRLLFSSLDIPIDIPASLPETQRLARQLNWVDVPQAITEVRNSLVHPEHKRRGTFDKVFFPVWSLGQWYLELALLRICDYSGTYSNRLVSRWAGEVEPVPWDDTKGK
ncbi:hypothetical protein ACFLZ8_04755 [Planctomycetota bacterium]